MAADIIGQLSALAEKTGALQYHKSDSKNELDMAQRRAKALLRTLFGPDNPHLEDMEKIRYAPAVTFAGMSEHYYVDAWNRGRDRFANLLRAAVEEAAYQGTREPKRERTESSSTKVFVVHGHDEALTQAVCRMISSLGAEPVVLREVTSRGMTIIEKLETHGDVKYAVVLLTPDDKLVLLTSDGERCLTRARQNVVLELGYFMGRLGRGRVAALRVREPTFDVPSDYDGVAWIEADAAGAWRYNLGKELRDAGYPVDLNRL